MEACREANYQYFGNWQDLTPEQQSKLIACYLLGQIIDQHQEDAKNAYQERQSRRKPKG
jgi:hypothetical protein